MAGKVRPCVHCGSLFRPEFPKGAARTCSDECSTARRRATHNAAAKAYYAKNAEEITAKVRERQKANPEARRAKWRKWASRHREEWNAYNRARYAEKKGRSNGA